MVKIEWSTAADEEQAERQEMTEREAARGLTSKLLARITKLGGRVIVTERREGSR